MIYIQFDNKTKYKFKYKKLYIKIVKVTNKFLQINEKTELSVIIIDNIQMKEISKKYRNKNNHTDVLSFPTNYKDLKKQIGYNLLGDIFLSWEEVKKQAKKNNHSIKREWCYLFTHALLHLLGYDHKVKKEEKEMNLIAYKILNKVNVYRNINN